MGLAMEKLGTMATGCDVHTKECGSIVHTVMATAMEKISFLVLSIAVATTVWTNLN